MPKYDLPADTKMAIGNEIRGIRDQLGYSQAMLGELVAEQEDRVPPYSQSTVQGWEAGRTTPPNEVLFIIERLANRPGVLTRLNGSVAVDAQPAKTVEEALVDDPDITPAQREMLMAAYEAARSQTRARRQRSARPRPSS